MYRKRASLSIVTLLLVLPLMAFFLFLVDTLRVSQAKQRMELSTNKAMEAALVEYDGEIYEKYRLMTLKGEEEPRAIFKRALDFSNNEAGSRPGLPSYKVKSMKLSLGAPLSDRKALKTAIIKKHEKYFIVSSLEQWMKKLEELKKLKPYAKACEAYSEGLAEVLKLKKIYDKLGQIYMAMEHLERSVGSIHIGYTIASIHELEEEIKALKEELSELRSKLRGFNSTMSPSTDEDNLEVDTDLQVEIERLRDLISEKEEELSLKRGLLDSVIERNKKLDDYYKKTSELKTKLEKAGIKVKKKEEEIENLSQEADIGEAKELVKKLVQKVDMAIGEIAGLEPRLKEDAGRGETQNRNIRRALNRKEAYQGENTIISLVYAKLSDNEKISSLFGLWDKRDGKVEVNTIMDIIWLALNGELLPDFAGLSEPDFSEAPHIPSKDETIQENLVVEKLLERYKESRPGEEDFGTRALEKTAKSSKDMADKDLSFDIKKIFDKMVIASYITDTFSHYSFKEEDKSKFFSGAEVEYILSGSESTKHNLVITQLKIFGLRFCLNFVPVALYKADDIDRMSLFLSSFTAGLGYPIYKGIVTLAWCSIETLADLKEINEGRGSIIIKTRNDIITSLSVDQTQMEQKELIDRELKKVRPWSSDTEDEEDEGGGDGKLRMNYEEHLFLFLLIENEDDSLIRIADLIALKEDLDTRKLYTALEADIGYNIGRLFPGARKYFTIVRLRTLNHVLRSTSSY